MIVDTSALLAILLDEDDSRQYASVIRDALLPRISAGTLLETSIVVERRAGPAARPRLDELLTVTGIVVEPVTEEQARIGRDAYRDFGRGSGHRARLNFGDCFAYALAQERGEPLLFKGNDFAQTDVRSALAAN